MSAREGNGNPPDGTPRPPSARAVVVSSLFSRAEMTDRIGREAYSYRFVFDAFAPLLKRWGELAEVTQAESRLDYALWRARQRGLNPVHLSFLPLHLSYLTQRAPNAAFPFWEFPDIPDTGFANNPRNNWAHLANKLSLILTASRFTRDAFLRAGVETPIHVVPVPVPDPYFSVPPWKPGQEKILDSPCYVFPAVQPAGHLEQNPWQPASPNRSIRGRIRQVYKCYIAPRLPPKMDKYLTVAFRTAAAVRESRLEDIQVIHPCTPTIGLSGVVFTTILNPFDPRKNWQDLLSAYLIALRDCADATLVIKLVVCPRLAAPAVNGMIEHYRQMGLRHQCKLVFVTQYLTDAQMVELAQASTFYINAARAEGACLPLQGFLAAMRPGIAARHTALLDYFEDDLGLVVESHPEPAAWPHDPDKRLTTRWHRLVWQSLHDQIQAAYRMAKLDQPKYQAMAGCGRRRMIDFASAECVWPRLEQALSSLSVESEHPPAVEKLPEPVRQAS